MQQEGLLKVDELRTEFFSSKTSSVTAVDKVSFDIYKGEILGLVGESGCGKSVTSLSVMQLLKDTPGKVTHGQVLLDGKDLLKMPDAEIRSIRGGRMSMIFQEPMSALNPSMRIDRQMMETIMLHSNKSKEEARSHAAAMLGKVGIPDPPRVLKNYPHQLSGGMSQRVMIAMALSCDPKLLIAVSGCMAQQKDVVEKFRQRYGGVLCSDVMCHTMGAVYDWKTPEGDLGYMEHNGTFHCATAVAFCAEIIARMIVDGELKRT